MISVLMPYTSGCEHRARAREHVLNYYATHHPEWELVEGVCAGVWSKGAALADAGSRASGGVLVVADADSFTDVSVLDEAVRLVESGEAQWVVPHQRVFRFNEKFTQQVLEGAPPRPGRVCRAPYVGTIGGGIIVLTRDAWETVGGIDARFLGWGGEDLAFGWALSTLVGPCVRLKGRLWHLWHPQEPKGTKRRGCPASEALAGRYRDAHGNVDVMRALVVEAKEVDGGSDPDDDAGCDDHATLDRVGA